MHTIKADREKFKLPAGLSDLKLPDWIFWLYIDFNEKLEPIEKRQTFFDYWTSDFSRKMKGKIAQFTDIQLWQALELLEWLHEADQALPFCSIYKIGGKKYRSPKPEMQGSPITQFIMADQAMMELDSKPENIGLLAAILYLPEGEKFDYEKSKARALLFAKADKLFLISVLYFFIGFKKQLREDYEELFEGTGEGDGLGWAGTLLGVAETQVFGNLEQVKETPLHEVFLFLVKKHREAERAKRNLPKTK